MCDSDDRDHCGDGQCFLNCKNKRTKTMMFNILDFPKDRNILGIFDFEIYSDESSAEKLRFFSLLNLPNAQWKTFDIELETGDTVKNAFIIVWNS